MDNMFNTSININYPHTYNIHVTHGNINTEPIRKAILRINKIHQHTINTTLSSDHIYVNIIVHNVYNQRV